MVGRIYKYNSKSILYWHEKAVINNDAEGNGRGIYNKYKYENMKHPVVINSYCNTIILSRSDIINREINDIVNEMDKITRRIPVANSLKYNSQKERIEY